MKKNDIKIIYTYIGYSDGSGSKNEFYPDMPEYVLMYFTSAYTMLRLPEEISNDDNIVRFHNWCYGRKMTRQQVIDFIVGLDDEGKKQAVLEKLTQIKEEAIFMLVTEDLNNADFDVTEEYMDKQLGHIKIEECIEFRSPVPMCSKQFAVPEPDVELGYIRGVFTGIDRPFFAKLWRSRQSGLKYVTLVFEYDFLEEGDWRTYEAENEVITVLNKSGLEVIGQTQDAEMLSNIIRFLGDHGIFRYMPKQSILDYSCYLCKDIEGNELSAYTTEITEPYEDESMKTRCNLKFITPPYIHATRAIELLEKKVGKLHSQNDYQERFQIVKEAIDQWDGEGIGYVPDEYDIESDKIAAIINEDNSVDEIAEAISHVFSLMFSHIPSEKCVWAAKLIREEFDMKYKGIADNSGRQKISDDKVNKFVMSGDWIYYVNRNDSRTLYRDCTDGVEMIHIENHNSIDNIYKVRLDGTDKQKLNNDRSWEVCIERDWLYYQNPDDGDRIYRIRTDGTERQKINDDKSSCLQVADGWIYYRMLDADNDYKDDGIYRIRINGSERQKICDDSGWNYKVSGEWLYYKADYQLYRIHIDGSEKSLICEDNISDFIPHGGWVYYSNYDDENKLYKICINGNSRQKLIDFKAERLTFLDGWLYCNKYVKEEYGFKRMGIYKMRLDGGEIQMLTDIECDCYIIDEQSGWIYYSNADDDSTIYRMRIDGTDKKKLNNDYSSSMQFVGEWLYYLKGKSGYSKIYRIPTSGIAIFNDGGGDVLCE